MSKQKVFGIGLNKTETTTLAKCLQHFGFRHKSFDLDLTKYVQNGHLEPVYEVADKNDSFEDWPWPLIFKKMDERYRNSKFILTTRKNKYSWIKSLKRHADRIGPTEFRELVYGFPMPHGHEDEHVKIYERHNKRVRSYFGNRGDFLEVCWEEESGWEEICQFLDEPVPNIPFPHANQSPSAPRSLFRKIQRAILD